MPRRAHFALPQPLFAEPVFSEGVPSPDPSAFKTPHPSDAQLYQQIQNLLTKDTVGFDPSRAKPGDLYTLESALGPHGPEIIQGIETTGQIVFHTVGDTGASNVKRYPQEIKVSDQLANDFHTATPANRPAFLYLLGDVVYDFGESQYYYDQFYEPFRNYPAPIFAIPGNHDSFIVPGTPADRTPLSIFMRNFCATEPAVTPEAASLHRTSMTQPGVYFALDAPFVRIIGLFSNALEDPGMISSEAGKWPGVPDLQPDYLAAQLKRIRSEKYAGAILLAVHHPPFCYSPSAHAPGSGGNHSSSTSMLRQIDTVCQAQGVYPHAILSGHAHNYERYTRTIHFSGSTYTVPFAVCGDGGHNVTPLVRAKHGQKPQEPANGTNVDYLDINPAVQSAGLVLEKYDDTHSGYLRVTVDRNQLQITFHQADGSLPASQADIVTVDLASHSVTSGARRTPRR